MARGHIDLPRTIDRVILNKSDLYEMLTGVDEDHAARKRILDMETAFRRKIDVHLQSLPTANAKLAKFNTSPFVLMFYSRQQRYRSVADIEKAIIPAKVFSSMETSAGRMVEEVVLPVYGWRVVPSTMHSIESVLDGLKEAEDAVLQCVTLKSGPRCLNDEMAKDIGADVFRHAHEWARAHSAAEVEFTFGALYGTKRTSNKKDWHILRNIAELLPADAQVSSSHRGA